MAAPISLCSRYIFGLRVDDVTYKESVDLCRRFIESGGHHRIVTPNPEFVIMARRDPAFLAVINSSSLSIPDGIGLVYASRIFKLPLREHVQGTDLCELLAAMAAREGYRLFLLGAAAGVAEAAAKKLAGRYPGLVVAGAYSGSPDPTDDDETVGAVRAAGKVDILLVAYGARNQELWLDRNLERSGVAVGIGVGGVFDYFSERVKRAPALVRKARLEWLYRLYKQPWRWRRQLSLYRFALTVLWSAAIGRKVVLTAPSIIPTDRTGT
ncbi:MAG: WecB/TagA/CpsF family glycosyltransferase [Dehalococcoidia bacterium]|nr:WecB/TagA/CpsF family glycosyltransferase [Dehalococcoidia bacterium]